MQRDGGPGGAGGAGNPTGGSFTGPAEALEIIGNHCYAYSGVISVVSGSEADTTCLKFTSGNFYSVVEVAWFADKRGNAGKFVDIKMNGASIYKGDYDEEFMGWQPVSMIIPPYTEFEFLWGVSGVNAEVTAVISGRIYRG